MTKHKTRIEWLEPIVRNAESHYGSESETAKAMRRDLEMYRKMDAEAEARRLANAPIVSFDPSMTPVERKEIAYRTGDLVIHQRRPEWGTGRVMTDSTLESVRVFFEVGEERTFLLPLDFLVHIE